MRYGGAETTLRIRPNWESIEISRVRADGEVSISISPKQTSFGIVIFSAHIRRSRFLAFSLSYSLVVLQYPADLAVWPESPDHLKANRNILSLFRLVEWHISSRNRFGRELLLWIYCRSFRINRRSLDKALNFSPTLYFKA